MTSGLPAISISLYYHTTNEEKHHMFPVDPNLASERAVTSSQTSTCQDNFHVDVEEQGGMTCVVTGTAYDTCDAAHCHGSKGPWLEVSSQVLDRSAWTSRDT